MRGLILVAVVGLVLAGCGGHSESDRPSGSTRAQAPPSRSGGAEGEEEGGGELSKLPAADRRAYLQIASAIGVLNKDASLVQVSGIMRPEDTAALPVLRRRIDGLRPRDALLKRLRLRTLPAFDLAIGSRRSLPRARRAAPVLLRAITRITQGLSRYATAHPAVGGFVPD